MKKNKTRKLKKRERKKLERIYEEANELNLHMDLFKIPEGAISGNLKRKNNGNNLYIG